MSSIGDAGELKGKLSRIDNRGYKAYKDIAGAYRIDEFTLFVDHVQGDPFAAPSKLRLRLDSDLAAFPGHLFGNRVRRIALEDFILRAFDAALDRVSSGRRGSGKSGLLAVDRPGQEILERTAVVVAEEYVEVRLVAGLPARGRKVLGYQAMEMLLDELPRAGRSALYYDNHDPERVNVHIHTAEDSHILRESLEDMGAVAFVADGSILPRESGVSDRPLSASGAVPFSSPQSLRREVSLPGSGRIRGMIVPRGVTLIVGGGYHGKSTLLRALDRGIYDHIPGDGRELVVTDPSAVKIRAEDGRSVAGVDIEPFIGDLPDGTDTSRFSTPTASGSTSQATNIAEALEMGTGCLLVDEDTSATNFMVRDHRMQLLVARDREPITPFIDRVRGLYRELGVSSVLVLGGSGDYFDVADTVIMMDTYLPLDVSAEANRIAREIPTGRATESGKGFPLPAGRIPDPASIDPRRRGKVRVRTRGTSTIQFGSEDIDLSLVEQLVDPSQVSAVGDILVYAKKYMGGSLARTLDRVEEDLDRGGLEVISPFRGHPGDYARPRMMEVAAAINRLRSLRVSRGDED